jgi:ABC-type branched-subunit amino acid transport system substrate-binding protein
MTKLLALAGTALALAAGGTGRASDPGVSSDKVVIGGTVPLSGLASAFGSVGPGAKAYFEYVNDHGGVNGRQIDYRYLDDGYDPARTVLLTRQLVQQDRVLAIFNSVGTDNNLAIRQYLNESKVPQLFVGDGSSALEQPGKYPWTMGFLPSYRGEGAVYGRTLVKTRKRARIAVIYENTELGKDLVAGLTAAIKGKGPRIVAQQSYEYTDPDISSQIASLRRSRADTLMVFATPKFAIQSFSGAHKLGWRPKVYVSSISIEPGIMSICRSIAPELTGGALSIAYVKNPDDPIWNKDPATKLYRTIMRKYNPSGRVTDVYNWYGMTVAWTMVQTLKKAGRNLSRASLLRAAQSLDLRGNPFLLPGVRIKTSKTLYYPIRQVFLYRYDNKQWVKASKLLDARA